ncbi:unnamed protein product, partial [Sphacelaria rigidula]
QVGKVIDPDGDNLADVGETIEYELVVTNTGNVRVGDLQVVRFG